MRAKSKTGCRDHQATSPAPRKRLAAALGVALFGGIIERFVLRRLAGAELAQVLVTLGLSFMVADVCLMQWGGDPIAVRVENVTIAVRRREAMAIIVAGASRSAARGRGDDNDDGAVRTWQWSPVRRQSTVAVRGMGHERCASNPHAARRRAAGLWYRRAHAPARSPARPLPPRS